MISVQGLSVEVEGQAILKNLTFTIDEGSFVSVIGPNGAGKSTLMRCLDGLQQPAAGRVEVAGRDVAGLSRRDIARIISYVPQGDDLELDYTVRAFVEMGRYPHLSGWASLGAADFEAVRSALEVTETAELADRTLATLSGGERQRALIAAALAQGGSVLLLDEPTSFLDYRHQVQLLEMLDRLRRNGLTIIAVSHDLNTAVAASDNVLALKDGNLVLDGPPEQVFESRALGEIFGIDFCLAAVPDRSLPVVIPIGSEG